MRTQNDPRFAPARHARQKLASFYSSTSCAPKMTLVLPRARHAQQKLASFCSSTPCATKTCPVLLQHAMRDKNLPRFTPARHARPEMAPILPLACRAKPELTLFFVLAQENEDHPWFLLFVLPHHHTISQDISHATLRTRSVPVAAEAKAMAILAHPSDLPRRIAHH